MPDRIESYKVICGGGLNSNENHLDLSDNAAGAATRLVNYEPSLYGGYRRIEGYEAFSSSYPEVDDVDNPGSAEGKVLGVAIFKDDMFVQLPGIHPYYGNDWSDDVIPGLLPTDVSTIMLKLSLLEMRPKEVDIQYH